MTDRERCLFQVVNSVIQIYVYELPVDVERLCTLFGIRFITFEEFGFDKAAALAGNRDGAAIKSPAGRLGVIYNDKAPVNRLRFTVAEELYHHLLSHTDDPEFHFGRAYSLEKYHLYETEAKRAAGMTLIPPTVYYRFRLLCSHAQIAKLCRVSEACVYTAAKYYDANEDEIRSAFTKKHIGCDTADLKRKVPLRPRTVEGISL